MAEAMLQQHLDEVRALLDRAQELFGANPIEPPTAFPPNPAAAGPAVR